MRLEKKVPIRDFQVTVRELTPRVVRNILAQLPTEEELKTMSVMEYVQKFALDLLNLLGDCIELPNGTTPEDLAFSEIEEIMKAFTEVNQAFFRVQERLIPVPLMPFLNWNAPVSPSVSTDTQTPGTGDGVSSQKSPNTPSDLKTSEGG